MAQLAQKTADATRLARAEKEMREREAITAARFEAREQRIKAAEIRVADMLTEAVQAKSEGASVDYPLVMFKPAFVSLLY